MAKQQGFINSATLNSDGTFSGVIGSDTGNRIIDFSSQTITNADGSVVTSTDSIPTDSMVEYYPNGSKAEQIMKVISLSVIGTITDSSTKAHLRATLKSLSTSSDTGVVVTIKK